MARRDEQEMRRRQLRFDRGGRAGPRRRELYRPHRDDWDEPWPDEALRGTPPYWMGDRYREPLGYGTGHEEDHWVTDDYEMRVRRREDAGPHQGRAPRGWKRSSERIREEICRRMTDHGWLDPRNLDIEVEGQEVTLRGTVEDRRQKRLAEVIADSVSGVVDVHNLLTLRHPAPEDRPQAQQRGGPRWSGGEPT